MDWNENDLFYPDRPGSQPGSDTSYEAARSMDTEAKTLRAVCLAALRRAGPLTADELAERVDKSVLAIRPRVTELKKLEFVRDTGERRPNESGRAAVYSTNEQPASTKRDGRG